MTEGKLPEHIAAGINLTVVKRVLPMLARYPEGPVVFAGGVARNAAVAYFIKAKTGRDLVTVPDPLFNGAIGCAIFDK